jgi:hypothetical protein
LQAASVDMGKGVRYLRVADGMVVGKDVPPAALLVD